MATNRRERSRPFPTTVDVRFEKSAGVTAAWVKRVVARTLKAEKKKGTISVLVTGDRQIHRLNRQFLKHDYPTDVISFNLNEVGAHSCAPLLGELVVSSDFAKRYAKANGLPYKEELARYLVHGTLHLLGYDDRKKKDKDKMFKRQERILNG